MTIEVEYGLFRNQTVHGMLYTLIASSIVHGIGAFEKDLFRVDKGGFSKKVGHLLCEIRADKGNAIDSGDVRELKAFFMDELRQGKYVTKIPLIGEIKNSRYRKAMKAGRAAMDSRILSYIETGAREPLGGIDPRIPGLRFSLPRNDAFGSFYRDGRDAYESWVRTRNGTADYSRYNEYYTESGEKKSTK